MFQGLPKADPRIDDHRLLGDPATHRFGQLGGEKIPHLADDVVVARLHLHRARRSLHMHQHHRHSLPGDNGNHFGIEAKRADIVDDIGAGFQGGLGHL